MFVFRGGVCDRLSGVLGGFLSGCSMGGHLRFMGDGLWSTFRCTVGMCVLCRSRTRVYDAFGLPASCANLRYVFAWMS